ncbi:MATE efflux family protein [Gottschalkia acidurici 9a]|uniref:Multidrug export protein MepA n=1 Tax=Gottschalkia acidurici (strain ATCC 7906 / DSM 604 / BCRC 14475 / CIP 104303 / KCTC 5404 / NCIMB 10678 / 9a) TaxID=1128398 RepID=K0B046_GOTA9|nr:MATE family efflux transporter [Gottschalkia acidurici]AFS79403.1 MATE efflux family protein [Gottschalkia acidurici 9a]
MDRSKQLGESPVGKLLLSFSVPAIIGMVVNAFYNIVDRIFIGHYVGGLGLAGVAVSYPIMIIVMAFGMLIGVGATSIISIRLGEGRNEDAEKVFGNAFFLLIIIPVLLSAFCLLFLDQILGLFGASENILPLAKEYLSIILYGSIFQVIGFGMNNFIRSEGSPRIAMMTMLIGAIINIVLDYVFIVIFNMGMKGAALATIIGQAASAIWVLKYFLFGQSLLKLRKENLKLKSEIVTHILSLGSAQFFSQIANSAIILIINRSLASYGGDIAISAYAIINSIAIFLVMPLFGINQGAQPIIGYNFGAKNYDRVKKTLSLAIIAATIIVVLGFIVIMAFPQLLVSMFSKGDSELTKVTITGLRVFLAALPVIGFQIISSNYFQATGKPKHALFLSLSRQVIVLIPAVLILPRFFGLAGVWAAGPVSDFISSLLTMIFLAIDMRLLNRQTKIS